MKTPECPFCNVILAWTPEQVSWQCPECEGRWIPLDAQSHWERP